MLSHSDSWIHCSRHRFECFCVPFGALFTLSKQPRRVSLYCPLHHTKKPRVELVHDMFIISPSSSFSLLSSSSSSSSFSLLSSSSFSSSFSLLSSSSPSSSFSPFSSSSSPHHSPFYIFPPSFLFFFHHHFFYFHFNFQRNQSSKQSSQLRHRQPSNEHWKLFEMFSASEDTHVCSVLKHCF